MSKRCYARNLRILRQVIEGTPFFHVSFYIKFSNISKNYFADLLNALISGFNAKKTKGIIGSSANAVIALLLRVGYTPNEVVPSKLSDIGPHKFNNTHLCPLSVVVKNKTQSIHHKTSKRKFTCLNKDGFFTWVQQQIVDKFHDPYFTASAA